MSVTVNQHSCYEDETKMSRERVLLIKVCPDFNANFQE